MSSHRNTDVKDTHDEDNAFTRKAVHNINAVIRVEDFQGQSAERIYEYLLSQRSTIKFCDHLKRYLYEHYHFDKPYADVTINEYAEKIIASFDANHVPVSLAPTSRKPLKEVKKWLTQSSVSRSVVFQLGFGLKMNEDEVDEFLKKAISETTFNMADYEEVIYQYCFYNQLTYDKAVSLLNYYQSIPENAPVTGSKKYRVGKMSADEELFEYLRFLKTQVRYELKKEKAYDRFDILLGKVRSLIASERRFTNSAHVVSDISENTKGLATSGVSYQLIEETIYSGISYNEDLNLQSMGDSSLKDVFGRYRLTRARMSSLQKRKIKVERYDLITLLFFIHAYQIEVEEASSPDDDQKSREPAAASASDADSTSSEPETVVSPDSVIEGRFEQFTEEADNTLAECGMIRLYPVNPYESFVMLCILSKNPLDSFSDVWYQSYHTEA